jgi:glucokinase
LVAAYETGDAFAREVWEKSVRGLGCAIASLINVLDPEAVIIGGGIASAGAALFDPLARVLEECEWRPAGRRVKIIPAQLGEWAGTHGAARNALQSIS